MRILFRFGDNDFRNTFTEVFHVILRAMDWPNFKKERLRDKDFVCALINELAYPVYRTVQCHDFPSFEKGRFASEEEVRAFYTNYLRATPDKIYIDEEIDTLLAEMGDGNGAWFVLDTKQHDPRWRVYAV